MPLSNGTNERGALFATGITVVVALALTAGAAAVWSPDSGEEKPSRKARFELPHQIKSTEFVTSDTCRSCHPGQYSSWHDSYHRTMTQRATPKAVVAPFDNVELQDDALTCRLERRGDEFWATVFETNWKERYVAAGIDPMSVLGTSRSPYLTRRIEMTTGSHHMQLYWISNESRMIELPFYYHIDGQRWIPRDDSVLAPPQPSNAGVSTAEWRLDCIKCHSTGGQPRLNENLGVFQSSVAEFGISCEACHGPAEEHVRHHRNPVNRYRRHFDGSADPTIVNPARLSHTASSQICGQCHISFNPRNSADFLANGLRYRAGDDLTKSHVIVEFKEGQQQKLTNFWQDGTCCVGGDEYLALIKSACHLRGTMSCLSCHSMHQSDPADQLANKMEGDHACLQCHASYENDIERHTHHAPNSSGSRCYNCHMPYTTYALFTAMRSHRVDSPDITSSLKLGRPNACNLCHLDRTLQWSAEHLTEWFGAPTVEMGDDEKTIAASLLWLLRGDAAQRVVTAWHMGWKPAQTASGSSWQAPFLAQLLQDPYSMVRYIAHEALTKLPGFEGFEFDYIGPEPDRTAAKLNTVSRWNQLNYDFGSDLSPLLLDSGGQLRHDEVERLLKQRDNKPIVISE
jgi:predicted CXXCH cytochrome family protein